MERKYLMLLTKEIRKVTGGYIIVSSLAPGEEMVCKTFEEVVEVLKEFERRIKLYGYKS